MLEGLSDEEQAKIAGGNLARIYGIGYVNLQWEVLRW